MKNYQFAQPEDKILISTDEIKEIFYPPNDPVDLALVILKKPINQILREKKAKFVIDAQLFAQNNLYNPSVHGWLYGGTPLYIAGFGRGFNGNSTDQNKSLKSFRFNPVIQRDYDVRYFYEDHYHVSKIRENFIFLNQGLLLETADQEYGHSWSRNRQDRHPPFIF